MRDKISPKLIKPGFFGSIVSADARRNIYDSRNEILLCHQVPVDFVFIGDSITEMWDLDTYFGNKGSRIVNRGISGDNTTFVLKRFSADVIQLMPRLVIIHIGINNTWGLDEWRSEDRKTVKDIEQDILNDIKGMVKLTIGTRSSPIITSLLPTNIDTNKQTLSRNEMICTINLQLKKYAEENQLFYIDYHKYMTKSDGKTLRDELSMDGLHPNVDGYNIMAETLKNILHKNKIII